MTSLIVVPVGDKRYYYNLRYTENYPKDNIIIDDVCIIRTYKYNDHNYSILAFFYNTKNIYSRERITSKKELTEYIRTLIDINISKNNTLPG